MNTWYVNTNAKYCEDCYEYMLKQNRIASWYNSAVNKIQQGDLILLHHNKKGFIAIGFATSNFKQHFEFSEEEWIEVKWIFKDFDNPINHNDIDFNGAFLRTVQNVSIDYKKLLIEMSKRAVTE